MSILTNEAKKTLRELAFEAIANGWIRGPISWPVKGQPRDLLIGVIGAYGKEWTDETTYELFENEFLEALEKAKSDPSGVLEEMLRRRSISFTKIRPGADWANGAYELSRDRYLHISDDHNFELILRKETDEDFNDTLLASSEVAAIVLDKVK